MAVKKMKNWTRKKIQEIYDFDLLPKNIEIMRSRRSSSSSSSSCGVDRISELPDELIRSILSLLTPREATVATTLSSSWRRLDADAANVVSLEFPPYVYPSYNIADAQESGFPECTNDAACVKFFLKFKFDLSHYDPRDRYNSINLRDWFKSAAILMSSSSSMEFVEIHVIYAQPRFRYHDYYYQVHHPSPPNPLKIFVEAEEYCLKLREVSLSGDGLVSSDIDLLLSKLVALERLSIAFSVSRDHFYIGRPEIKTKLKHLKITPTFSIKIFRSVFISHLDNLVSLSYTGLRTDLDHVPKLVDATVHSSTRNIGDIHPRLAAQLLRLRLYFTLVNHKTMLNYGKFTKLKHLELNVEIDSELINIQHLCPLIEAFPCILELKVKFLWLCDPCKHKRRHDEGGPIPMMNRMSEMSRLQVVKMSGCVGSVFELELALYVINNASTLKELVLEPGDRNNLIQSRRIDGAFQHLLSVAPSHVDLILL